MKSKGNVLLIVLLLVALAAAGTVGYLYWQRSQGVSPEIGNPTYTQLIPDSKPDETSNWNTYKNQEYKYEMKYPQDWYVNELTGDHPSGKNFRMLGFSSPNKEYRLLFGLRNIGENVEITSRTGVGAGDFAAYKTVKIGNTEVNASKLVYLDKTKEIYYSNNLGPGIVTIEGHEVVAEFGVNSDANYQPYENYDLNNVPELLIANQILSTFRFTNSPQVTTPQENSTITSPATIEGTVPAGWMFEGVFPIKITDLNGKVLGQGQGEEKTPGNWMSGKSTEFRSSISFTKTAPSGYIVLMKDNPSGLPENDSEFKIMIYFK